MSVSGYWMHEASGGLRPAVVAYLHHEPLSEAEIGLIREYLREWSEHVWSYGDKAVEPLRAKVDGLTSIEAINEWIDEAVEIGIDPR